MYNIALEKNSQVFGDSSSISSLVLRTLVRDGIVIPALFIRHLFGRIILPKNAAPTPRSGAILRGNHSSANIASEGRDFRDTVKSII
jgi:hypothetical protein